MGTRAPAGRPAPAGPRDGAPPPGRRRAFVLNAGSGGFSKLAEQVASPDVVLAALLLALGAPTAFVGALEPVRRGVATLPQLLMAPWLRRAVSRSRVWAGAAVVQAVVWATVAVAAVWVTGGAAGAVVLGGLVLFSLASGAASAVFSDVTGATVDKAARGRLMALRSGLGGVATLLFALWLVLGWGAHADTGLYVGLLAGAGGLWLVSAALFALIGERAGPAATGERPMAAVRRGLRALRAESWFARFTVARALLVGLEVVIPYLTLLVHRQTGRVALGLLVLAVGVAQLAGSPLWGRLIDRLSARAALVTAGALGGAAMAVAVLAAAVAGSALWPFLLAVVLAGTAREGVRTARKTYLVNAAPGADRSLYTATSNSVTGVVLLGSALLGLLAQSAGPVVVLVVLGAASFAGAAVAARLARN